LVYQAFLGLKEFSFSFSHFWVIRHLGFIENVFSQIWFIGHLGLKKFHFLNFGLIGI
jgi:hypothetical protein